MSKEIIASTHKDKQGTLAKQALQSVAEKDAGRIFPLTLNFDLRVPPLGNIRILPDLEEQPDGCWALMGEVSWLNDALRLNGIAIGYIVEPFTLHNVSATNEPSDPHCILPESASLPDLPLAVCLYTFDRMENAEPTLRAALGLAKYPTPFHVHIADDGSPDGYRERLREIAAGYPNVRNVTVTNAERGGYGRSYNLASQAVHDYNYAVLSLGGRLAAFA